MQLHLCSFPELVVSLALNRKWTCWYSALYAFCSFLPCFCCSRTTADWPGSGSLWPGPRSPSPPDSGLQSAMFGQCLTQWGSRNYPPLTQTHKHKTELIKTNIIVKRQLETRGGCTVTDIHYLSCLRFLSYRNFSASTFSVWLHEKTENITRRPKMKKGSDN